MEQRKPMTHAFAGVSIAVLVILIAIITMVIAGNGAQPGSGLLTYATIIAGLILFINLYGKSRNGEATFSELFSYGFKATAVYTVIFVGFLILFALIFPDFKPNAIEATRAQMASQKNVTPAQANESMVVMEKYFWVFAIGGTTLFFVIVGAIGSLVGAYTTKKNNSTPHKPIS